MGQNDASAGGDRAGFGFGKDFMVIGSAMAQIVKSQNHPGMAMPVQRSGVIDQNRDAHLVELSAYRCRIMIAGNCIKRELRQVWMLTDLAHQLNCARQSLLFCGQIAGKEQKIRFGPDDGVKNASVTEAQVFSMDVAEKQNTQSWCFRFGGSGGTCIGTTDSVFARRYLVWQIGSIFA